MTDPLERLADRLTVSRHRADGFDALCPAHGDRHSSLAVNRGDDGGLVVFCHAGCATNEVLKAVGMGWSEIMAAPHIEAEYVYRNAAGAEIYRVERWQPKDFRVRPGLPPVAERRLYHTEWLPEAREQGRTVYVVEGEKDADRLAAAGEIAVCGAGGAGKWLPPYTDQLDGIHVVVIADADEPGRDHARAVAAALDGRAASVALTEPSYGKDISDQLDAGYALSSLVALSTHEALAVSRADHIREGSITWLWPGYLPRGKLVMVDGDPGDGKSVMTVDLAARLSTGAPMPDGSRCPTGATDVVMISAEDDPEDTITPRLRAAGANRSRVHLVYGGPGGHLPFSLTRDLDGLEQIVHDNHAGLIVIDPIMAFLGGDVDSHRDQDVRSALHPLTRMAARTGATVLVVRHLTKSRSKAIYAGGGSIAFTGAARVAYMVGQHPDEDGRRVMSCVKINIGTRPASLAYRVEPSSMNPDVPRVMWDLAPVEMSAQDLLDGEDALDERSSRDEAREFLSNLLRENPSGLLWQDILTKAKKEGHADRTLQRSRRSVGKLVRNPIDSDGNLRRGCFWVPLSTAPGLSDDPDEDEGNVVPFRRREPAQDDSAPSVPPVDDRPVPAAGPCDVCGAEPAVPWGDPYFVRRCIDHNPLTFGDQ